jgi:hypothetical protein
MLISPPNYIHAEALAELNETVELALDELEYIEQPVILGAHLAPNFVRSEGIIYNTEHPSSGWMTPSYQEVLSHHEVWDYHRQGVGKYVPIGFMPQLCRILKPATQDIDVLFYGSRNKRRDNILAGLLSAGLKVKILTGVYGEERDNYIARSKVVLNVHYYEPGIFEVVRVSYLWANAKCVVSEESPDSDFGVPYDDLVEACLLRVRYPAWRTLEEEAGYDLFSAVSEVDILRTALNL